VKAGDSFKSIAIEDIQGRTPDYEMRAAMLRFVEDGKPCEHFQSGPFCMLCGTPMNFNWED
jgi:hypothetical protein